MVVTKIVLRFNCCAEWVRDAEEVARLYTAPHLHLQICNHLRCIASLITTATFEAKISRFL
jgi:hypothetical protein